MEHTVSFPKLGWEFNLSDTIVEFPLFGTTLAVKWYGVLIATGFLLAVIYALRRAREFGVDPDRMIDVTLVSALFAFLGARLYYVLFSDAAAAYLKNPVRILQVWEGGLAIYGGIILAFVTALWMCRVRKVNTLAMFDIASLGFLIGQGIGRWGNFFNQEAFGGNTELPWGMSGSLIRQLGLRGSGYNPALPVHPTFLYESLWCLLGFVLLHLVSKRAYKFKGQIFSTYLMWYGLGRFMIEGLRTDSLTLGTMRVSQIVAALSVLGGAALFFVLRSRRDSLSRDLFAQPDDGPTISLGDAEEEDGCEPDDGARDESPAGEVVEETAGEPADDAVSPPAEEDSTATQENEE